MSVDASRVGDRAIHVGTAGPLVTGPDIESHIDGFRVTCVHEQRHHDDFTAGVGGWDKDKDGLANFLEDTNGNGVYDRGTDMSDYTDKYSLRDRANPDRGRLKYRWSYYTDAEWRAFQAELDWANDGHLGEYDMHDWTKNGPNWDHQ